MEADYKHGKIVAEPVYCPDNHYLHQTWWDSFDLETNETIRGVEFRKNLDPEDQLGTGAWYSLEELKLLGGGDLKKGIIVAGEGWYETSWFDIHTIRPMNEMIKTHEATG